jgi:hypothetical protein
VTATSEDRKSSLSPPSAVPQQLRDALHLAQQNHLASVDTLRSAVCDYVDEMRESGIPYDDVVRAVQNLVGQHYRTAQRSPDVRKENAQMVQTMIQWCKDHWEQPAFLNAPPPTAKH